MTTQHSRQWGIRLRVQSVHVFGWLHLWECITQEWQQWRNCLRQGIQHFENQIWLHVTEKQKWQKEHAMALTNSPGSPALLGNMSAMWQRVQLQNRPYQPSADLQIFWNRQSMKDNHPQLQGIPNVDDDECEINKSQEWSSYLHTYISVHVGSYIGAHHHGIWAPEEWAASCCAPRIHVSFVGGAALLRIWLVEISRTVWAG